MPKVSRKHDKADESSAHQKPKEEWSGPFMVETTLTIEAEPSVIQVYPLVFSISMELPGKI